MNRRNIDYIGEYNPRRLFPLVDNKLQTKQLALENGVNVPDLIGVIAQQYEVNSVSQLLRDSKGFCIKPAKGSGGKGILVIADTKVESKSTEAVSESDLRFIKANGQALGLEDIQRHTSNILAGLYSLGGAVDTAVFESLIVTDPILAKFSYEGVPDVRIIVFRGIPVMAMMRLSCSESSGKANLHQGAVGVGIDIASGKAINAVQNDLIITHHPDTKQNLLELQVPSWKALLEMACVCCDMSGLGYLGVDLVLDQNKGPILLELNARPGLSIQIANQAGLLPRLNQIEALSMPDRMELSERIDFACQHFCSP